MEGTEKNLDMSNECQVKKKKFDSSKFHCIDSMRMTPVIVHRNFDNSKPNSPARKVRVIEKFMF